MIKRQNIRQRDRGTVKEGWREKERVRDTEMKKKDRQSKKDR